MGLRAKIEQSAPNHPPTMGEGDVDASLLWDWFVKSENYLCHKNTPAADMVKTVAHGMGGVHAIRWLAAHGPSLHTMDWDDYKEQMRSLFLPVDWEYTTRMSILRMKQGSRPFIDFALDVLGKNNLLAGTASFMNDDFVCDALEAGMEPNLAQECHQENMNHFDGFRVWMDEVKRLDEQRRQCFEEIAREFARLNVKGSAAAQTSARATRPTSTVSSTSKPASSFVPIPKLLDSERSLLQNNGSCFKCRRFWAGHIGPHCPHPPIDGATYKTITSAPPRPANYVGRGGPVAAVLEEPLAQQTSIEEELISFENVAAVLPNVVSSVMDTGSPGYSDDEYAPFSCSNMFWSCHPLPPSAYPPSCASPPLTLKGLIDDGSSVVLIKESVADMLKLPRFVASQPFVCQPAFSTSKTLQTLASYVKIQPTSVDGTFSSLPLRAFVSPSLVTDLILGLPFLTSNLLIVDHGSRSCIVKLDNERSYDLLHPVSPFSTKPIPLWRTSHIRASEIHAARQRNRPAVRDVLLGDEMTARLKRHRAVHPSRGQWGDHAQNVVASIKECIEDLNAVETYQAQL
ncbi:hypothetical protein BDN71DRAFT_1506903 [Pleurotus eryngii]|uniref:Uncharacterized protein n=1 Tax=Pleurotus eryngii TaxID=5323 RepID=A0A9P5ZYB0_PLEER|nr:hypothetical protein BDN71DRAFT_1506903 [Pleurotus eryngii]